MSQDAEWAFGRNARDPVLSEEQRAALEAKNTLRQYDRIAELVASSGNSLTLTPGLITEFHRLAVQGICADAGAFRQELVLIGDARHLPPSYRQVPELIDGLCEYVNNSADTIHIAAFLLWRVNWIHPFRDGNGRVARALCYLGLCVGFGFELPGTPTIATLLLRRRDAYLAGLEDADQVWRQEERIDVRKLETLLSDLIVEQAQTAL